MERNSSDDTDVFVENSWRYSNGELIQDTTMNIMSVSYANAWNKENGVYINSEGDEIPNAQKKGIDVSKWQGQIDWEKVKAAGIDFAIIRCGYGVDNSAYDDEYWEYNASECERLGIDYGVYIYSYATSTADAASEAQHALRLLKDHSPTYPVYLDMEDNSTISVGNAMLGNIAETFCDTVSASNYDVGIYANKNWWNTYLTSSVFDNISWSKWVAQYNATCTYTGSYDMWQCSSTGTVDGIDGYVDIDFWVSTDADPVETDDSDIISYRTHMQTYGWQDWVENGYQSGTTGLSKRMEAIQISVGDSYDDLGVTYCVSSQTYGWMDYVSDGETAGTTGKSKYIEAIRIKLTGDAAGDYDIYYRVHCQTYGWTGWAKNGEAAGTYGYDKRMEAIQITVIPVGSSAPGSTSNVFRQSRIKYNVHVQSYGWQGSLVEGAYAGTTGLSKRLEAIQITLTEPGEADSIRYRVHVQTDGWENSWTTGGGTAGTTGEAKRLEAIQIELTGDMAEKYDVYYRVHVQTYGWLGWAKNGESAGTEGLSKRMESIQIVLIEKGGSSPGSTERTFIKG
ncbi:MAG: hypothetical protein LIO80_08310 [Lachnospiraceae bacterium]|nr:hypothetical protein [Lachnospiraceae bacterium]